jgi:RNA polymerase sigma-70 factor, ECF subfamily
MIAIANPNRIEDSVVSVLPAAEAEFVRLLRAGDSEASEDVVRMYGGRMLAVARRMLRSEEDAADVVQDAFLAAFRSIHRFQGDSQLYTWLHRIVVNAALMKLRSRRRVIVSLDALLPEFDADGNHVLPVTPWQEQAATQLERTETRSAVRACIDRLPDDYRAILVLRDIEELDTDETAAVLGLSRSNVKTRLHRARMALRTLLEQSGSFGA